MKDFKMADSTFRRLTGFDIPDSVYEGWRYDGGLDLLKPMTFGAIHTHQIIRANGTVEDELSDHNLVPNAALNHILNLLGNHEAIYANRYVSIYGNNYVPVVADVMSTFPGGGVAGEITTYYSESTRPAYTTVSSTAQLLTNTASKATFTAASITGTVTIYGSFVTTNNTKAGTTGLLVSAAKFSTARTFEANGDQLILKVEFSLANA